MKAAELISKLLNPLILVPVSAFGFVNFSGISFIESVYWLSLWIALSFLPVTVLVWFTGDKGFNIYSRESRGKVFLVGLIAQTASLALFEMLSAPLLVLKLGVVGLIGVTVFGLANHFDKASIHTGAIAGIAPLYSTLSLSSAAVIVASATVVGWSRVELNQHTFLQVIQGGFLGLFCGLIFLWL